MKVAKPRIPWNEKSALGRIVHLVPFAVTPPRGGGHMAVLGINRALSERYQILQFCTGIRKENFRLPLGQKILKIKDNLTEYQYLPLAALGAFLLKGRTGIPPLFASRFLSLKPPKYLKLALKDADLIVVEEPWLFRWALENRCPHQPIVLIAQNVESDLLSMILEKRVFPFRNMLVQRARKEEAFAFRRADAVVVYSEEDGQRLLEFAGLPQGRICTIPLGIDMGKHKAFTEETRESLKKKHGLEGKRVVLFMGSWHPPNREALAYIEHIAGSIRNDVRFLVLGSVGPKVKKESWKILYKGFVEDPAEYVALADLAINPMQRGSGVNVKMLHYLAEGLSSITTPVGARGLKLEHGKNSWIVPLSRFPEAIEELVGNDALRERLGKEGRKLVEREYTCERVAHKRHLLFQELLSEKNSNYDSEEAAGASRDEELSLEAKESHSSVTSSVEQA